jgi:hypothetical protein
MPPRVRSKHETPNEVRSHILQRDRRLRIVCGVAYPNDVSPQLCSDHQPGVSSLVGAYRHDMSFMITSS